MHELDRVDVVVVGAGVVGLAVARELAIAGRDVVVLEAESVIGAHTSSRNSEVIHAGIYYPTGSLKARHCVAGKRLLYEYCAAEGVAHQRLGKLLVATRDEELPALERLRAKAIENGVHDLVTLSAAEVRELEPSVRAVGGVLSPSTGIVDSHAFMRSLLRDAERHGAQLALASPVVSGRLRGDGIELAVGGTTPTRVVCGAVVNAAGLFAQGVARSIEGFPAEAVPECHYAKGHYFVLAGKSPFSRLVYPIPVPGGLGVHVTLDLAGQARFGPDVNWVDAVDYRFDETRAGSFIEAIRAYYPEIDGRELVPGYTGIRPKLGPSTSPAADFVVQGPEAHGVAGLVNLFGIESPGLTAALPLAQHVASLLG